MSDSRGLLDYLTRQLTPSLQQTFPELETSVTHPFLAGVVYRTVRFMGKLLFELSQARETFVMGQPLPLPEISMERHPDEIQAFFEPRPWYRDKFEEELEHVGDHFEYLNTASAILPGGNPPDKGGEGYLSEAWSQFPWMAELFQEMWEREQYPAIVRSFQNMPDTEVDDEQIVHSTCVYVMAQVDVQELDKARLESFLKEKLLPRLRDTDFWENDDFWDEFGSWVDSKR